MNSTLHQLKSPRLTGTSIEGKREEIKQFFINTWQTYESLFSQINNDSAFYKKPEPLRHPLIFYYGHTATFFINKLILGKYINQRVNHRLESICAVGVDEMSWDDLNTDNYEWPSVAEVQDYRNAVFIKMLDVIKNMPIVLPITQDSLVWIVLMGCEHERIHLETSSVIMRMLPIESITPSEKWLACNDLSSAPQNKLISVEGKPQVLGKCSDDKTYGWDNEYGSLEVEVENFKVSQFLVSNQEFMQFVQADGYKKLLYWDEEGRNWLSYKKPTMPVFWIETNGQYFQRNLNNVIPLPMSWPVEVNYLEAKAFCNWKSEQTNTFVRMPTEAEWYRLRDYVQDDLLEWDKAPGNVNLEYYASSCPVDSMMPAKTEHNDTIFDVLGNVWQWTESAIDGFNGFNVHPLYDDFSTPTFDGKHNLIKGASWISTGNEAIKSSRYAFRRHFFQHAGFRYIESIHKEVPVTEVNIFETDFNVSQQLESHYGETTGFINYPKAIAQLVIDEAQAVQLNSTKCLDLGCSVGRVSFELARHFELVNGVDFSARYIQHGVQLQNNKVARYALKQEGDIVQYKEYSFQGSSNLATPTNIEFSQGDASNLKDKFSSYDLILAQHVLEQSYDPAIFLSYVHERLNDKGLLIVTSDYQFDERITAKNKWIGGVKVNGENVTGFDGLSEKLAPQFVLLNEHNIVRALTHSDRQYTVSAVHVTVWQKR